MPLKAFPVLIFLLTIAVQIVPVRVAAAQTASKIPRIGVLSERPAPDPMVAAFLEGLGELGYVEGRNIVIERRHGQGASDRYPGLVAELIGLKVDILVVGGSVATRSAKAATTTVPIVFTSVGDPVAAGFVRSLSRPGGNATGLSNISADLGGKQLELLKMAAPKISRIAVLHDPLSSGPALNVVRDAARTLGLQLQLLEVRHATELPRVFSTAASRRADAILAISSPVIGNALPEVSKLAAMNRLPSIYSRSEFAEEGGLLAYGPSFSINYRRAAAYVDKILKGAKPGDLPVEQPTRFEFVVNLNTAKALGLVMPPSVVQRADRVIE